MRALRCDHNARDARAGRGGRAQARGPGRPGPRRGRTPHRRRDQRRRRGLDGPREPLRRDRARRHAAGTGRVRGLPRAPRRGRLDAGALPHRARQRRGPRRRPRRRRRRLPRQAVLVPGAARAAARADEARPGRAADRARGRVAAARPGGPPGLAGRHRDRVVGEGVHPARGVHAAARNGAHAPRAARTRVGHGLRDPVERGRRLHPLPPREDRPAVRLPFARNRAGRRLPIARALGVLRRIPIRWRLAAAFAVSMAALLLALGGFVYLRVEDALRSSVDQDLRAQSAESLAHAEDGSLLDTDARRSGMVAQVVGPDGRVVQSDPVSLPALLDPAVVAAARRGDVLTTVSLGAGELNRWRVLAAPDGDRVLVVAHPLRQTEETLDRLFGGLLVAGPLALLPVPPSRDEIHDLATTLNEMLARLEAALEHERRFVADASHELRTPLALLKAELELALRRPRTAEELRAAVGSAAEETDRLVVLAEDLLLIARSDQEALGLRVEPVDLGALARSTAERFAERASTDHRRVDVEIPPRTEVSADRLRLEQALRNLVDNALGYGEGRVTITTRDVGDAIEIHVLDEGEGFPPEVAARAFERFTRGDDARTRGGSGLGLAIVEAVAQAHGGSVGIAPNGNGADVWLSLPGHTIS